MDVSTFFAVSSIILELQRPAIPHFKAENYKFDLAKCKFTVGLTCFKIQIKMCVYFFFPHPLALTLTYLIM